MTQIDATNLNYAELNERVREAECELTISGCIGQRFLAAGMSDKKMKIRGIPGNALGAYLNGALQFMFAATPATAPAFI